MRLSVRRYSLAGLGLGHQQVLHSAQLVEQRLASTVSHAAGTADEAQLDIARQAQVMQQGLVVALGHEYRVESLLAQAFADRMARTDHPCPGQAPVMGAELAGVLAGNVVLVGIVLEDHQVGHAADEADLAHFLLETEEEQDAVVARDIHVLAEVAAQVGLLPRCSASGYRTSQWAAMPSYRRSRIARCSFWTRNRTFIRPSSSRLLRSSMAARTLPNARPKHHASPSSDSTQNNSCRRTALRMNSSSP